MKTQIKRSRQYKGFQIIKDMGYYYSWSPHFDFTDLAETLKDAMGV